MPPARQIPFGARIILASHNAGKLQEITSRLAPWGIEVVLAGDRRLPEPVEDGTTLHENALIKAKAAHALTGEICVSDDSGLFVEALDGAPGVYTADWCVGDDGSRDYAAGISRIRDALAQRGAMAPYHASMRTLICVIWPDAHVETFEGRMEGTLSLEPQGQNGFAVDPYFTPDGETRTFAEMTPEEKASYSPRMAALDAFLTACFSEGRKPGDEVAAE